MLCMNDYSEVNYPYQLFKNFFHSESLLRKRFHDAFQIADEDYDFFFMKHMDELAGFNRFQLFVTCFSEHLMPMVSFPCGEDMEKMEG